MGIVVVLLAFSCTPKAPVATTPAPPSEVAEIAERVAERLIAWEGFGRYDVPPPLVVRPMENLTRFEIDTALATTKLVNDLIPVSGERFHVVDDEAWAARPVPKGRKKGADDEVAPLLLHADIRSSHANAGDGTRAVRILVTYRLVETDTARAVWAADFEWTKRRGKRAYEVVEAVPAEHPVSGHPPETAPAAPPAPAPEPPPEPAPTDDPVADAAEDGALQQ